MDTLFDLDGEVLFIDERHWVRFTVMRVEVTPERPHGLSYSLTLHDETNERLVGFDNAHSVRESAGPAGGRRRPYDHRHGHRTIRPYDYKDAATLLADFRAAVDAVLKERGIRP